MVAADPAVVRSAPGPLADVFDPPFPAVADGAFGGGWIGYLGYSAGGEALAPARPRRLPAWWFGWYDNVLVRDRATGEWFFEALWIDARAAALERRFADLAARATEPAPRRGYEFSPFRLTPGAAGHQAAVARAVEYIRAGDIFQANICLRAEAEFDGDPLDAFCQAAELEPPYAAFIGVSAVPARRRQPEGKRSVAPAPASRAPPWRRSRPSCSCAGPATRSPPSRSRAPPGAAATRRRRRRSWPSSSGRPRTGQRT